MDEETKGRLMAHRHAIALLLREPKARAKVEQMLRQAAVAGVDEQDPALVTRMSHYCFELQELLDQAHRLPAIEPDSPQGSPSPEPGD